MARNSDRSATVATAFGRARGYDSAARVQRLVAQDLARRIGEAGLIGRPEILELGCGTGFLTTALHQAVAGGRWTVTDLSLQMVDRARHSIGDTLGADARWLALDGEHPDPSLGRFDLIASSMAFQWFENLPRAIARLAAMLNPGGLLAFATMVDGSFGEWSSIVETLGWPRATPVYPSAEQIETMAPAGFATRIEKLVFSDPQRDSRSFLRDLKAIGAGTPAAGYRPLPPAVLREAMARFDAGARTVSYAIAFCLVRAPAA